MFGSLGMIANANAIATNSFISVWIAKTMFCTVIDVNLVLVFFKLTSSF
ncbi:hypothetical protein AO381_1790 [Moraxella catarrhalis]|nr:hypothetical protein AO381_1790 [Moraxella catarrhalis]